MPKKVYKSFVYKLSDFFAETLDLRLLLVHFYTVFTRALGIDTADRNYVSNASGSVAQLDRASAF